MSNISVIQEDIYGIRTQFDSVLVDSSISFDREAGFALQILESNDYALKIAIGNRQSVINAVTNIAAIGISLNPAKKQAYLVPRKGGICLEVSYMGLIDLATASGSVLWVHAEMVAKSDSFKLHGYDKAPTHDFDPFGDRGDWVGAYCVAKTIDGDYLTNTMSIGDIRSVMNRSESVKSGKSSPWKTDFSEMAKKTVVKQASKYWPRSERVASAVHLLNTEAGEGLDMQEPQKESEQPVGRKPDVAMPEARKRPAPEGVTDVEPKQKPAQSNLCSEGERMFISRKLERKQWSVAYAREIAGLNVSETLDNLTADEFIALKDVLK